MAGKAVPIQIASAGGSDPSSIGFLNVGIARQGRSPARPSVKTEINALRTENSRTWENPDGTYTKEVSQGPMNYRDAAGAWQPIDLSLTPNPSTTFGLKVAADNPSITIGTQNGEAGLATAAIANGPSISMRAVNGGVATVGADHVSFAAQGSDAAVSVLPAVHGFELEATWVNNLGSPYVDFALNPGGLTLSIGADQSIAMTDAAGNTVGVISPAILFLGDDQTGIPQNPSPVTVSLIPGAGLTGETIVRYTVDSTFFASLSNFPLTLDPQVCLGQSCSAPYNGSTNIDGFVESGVPSVWTYNWNVTRVGYDVYDSNGYQTMRGLEYFPDVSLGDGSIVTSATLHMRVGGLVGWGSDKSVHVYRVTDGDGWQPFTSTTGEKWAMFGTGTGSSGSGNGYTTTNGVATNTVAVGSWQTWDVTNIVQGNYTRNAKNWTFDQGFALVANHEGSSYGEVQYSSTNNGTTSYKPYLTINYDQPKVQIDFAPELGTNYAPSAMVVSQTSNLPIVVTNNSAINYDTTNWKVGYRWYDSKGNVAATGEQALSSPINAGTKSSEFNLAVAAPSTTGQYTLRLDLVRVLTSYGDEFASDWATPSSYLSRNKKVLSTDNTRWVGSSAIERDEFPITVVPLGGNIAGFGQSVPTGDGGTLGVNLWTHDLTYQGAGGIGYPDVMPMSLTYGYDAGLVTDCTGILGACGWYTNFDERIVVPATADQFTYQDASGSRSLVSVDPDGQLTSNAGALLSRPRVTIWDESGLVSGQTYLVAGGGAEPAAYSGANEIKVPSGTSTGVTPSGFQPIDLNNYQVASFAVRTSPSGGAASSAIAFKIHDVNTSNDRWFLYTVGTAWTPTGFSYFALGPGGQSSLSAGWNTYRDNLWNHIKLDSNFGAATDAYQITQVQVQSAGSNANSTYVDAWRMEPVDFPRITDTNPTWTTNNANTGTVSSDKVEGSNSIEIPSAAIGSSPDCLNTGCTSTTDLGQYTFGSWWWKKIGGVTAAVVFHVKDTRTGAPCATAPCDLIYYAGPTAPPPVSGVTSVEIQVSDTAPASWTKVTRNLLRDAQDALNLFNDNAGSSTPTSPGQGPTPDPVQTTGYRVSGVDGTDLLIDNFRLDSLPDIALDEYTYPTTQGDSHFTYDFSATYPSGEVHYFNQVGLLTKIADANGNAITLDWAVTRNIAGQSAYQLTTIHAPSDGSASGGATYRREIGVTYGGSAPRTVTFTELLGTTSGGGGGLTGRATTFTIQTASGTGIGPYAAGDITNIKPARIPTCAGTAPTGCDQFDYTDTTNHLLQHVYDPRYTSSVQDAEAIVWSSGKPGEIDDNSAGPTPMLKVNNWSATASAPASTRVEWQDQAGLRSGYATYTDLTNEGQVLYQYIPLACGGDCAAFPPSTSNLANQIAEAHQFDGLSGIESTITYRCPASAVSGTACGGTVSTLVSRTASKAAAKVDNYSDPLTAGETAWTQTPDQFYASMRDSNGANPDLYRTAFTYDGRGAQVSQTTSEYNGKADYVNAIKTADLYTSTALKGYWRLNDSSGTSAADSSGNNFTGTYQNFSSGDFQQAGALINDATNKSVSFDGTNNYISPNASFPSISGTYTVVAWINPAASSATEQTFIGSRTGADYGFEVKLCNNEPTDCPSAKALRVSVGNGSSWLGMGSLPFSWNASQWYMVAVVVDSYNHSATVFVDGTPIGAVGLTTGTPLMTDATRNLQIGRTGLSSAEQYFTGLIDEVGVWATSLDPDQLAGLYQAGRAMAYETTETFRDANGNAAQVDDQKLRSPGFESGALEGWVQSGGTIISANPDNPSDPNLPNVHTGYSAFDAGAFADDVEQDVQLVPGQTFRFQVWVKTSGTETPWVGVYYFAKSTGALTQAVSASEPTNSTYTSYAWDVTLPLDADGRVRIYLSGNGDGGASDHIYFDDAALLTTYARRAYAANGLATDAYTFAQSTTPGAASAEIHQVISYADDHGATALNDHPGIFPTSVTQNYSDGSYNPTYPDQDVTSHTTFDGFGHALSSTDQDGVTSSSAYMTSSGTGQYTDIASASKGSALDGSLETTTTSYDLVGNVVSSTDGIGRTTLTTYDFHNRALSRTDPAGIVTTSDYDGYGFETDTVANSDATTPGPGTPDNVKTTFSYDNYGHRSQSDGDANQSGYTGLDARTMVLSDMSGNTVTTTVYPGTAGGGTGRVTTQRYAAYQVPAQTPIATFVGLYLTQAEPAGTQLPVFPSSGSGGAPSCPDLSGAYCNSASTIDANGRAVRSVNADGKVTSTYADLAGATVATIANFTGSGVYNPANPDQNLTSITQYGINAKPVATYDTLANGSTPGNATVSTYDALARVVTETKYDNSSPTPVALTKVRTIYTGAGRVDRVSLPADPAASDSSLTWTKSVYDLAGNQIRAVNHDDPGGNAGTTFETFEQPVLSAAWLNSSHLVSAGATLALTNGLSGSVAPATGRGDLSITTSASTANTGAAWDLSGQTFQSGHAYRISADVLAPPSTSLSAYLGVDAAGGDYVPDSSDPALTGNGSWQTLSFNWSPANNVSSTVHFVIVKALAGSVTFQLDNVRIWDVADPTINVPSETVYDSAGQAVESVAAPSNLQTRDPEVSATAFDAAGRAVSKVTNAALVYSHVISGEPALTNYWPMGEIAGQTLNDLKGSAVLTTSGGVALGQAGAVDEPRTSAAFDGNVGQASGSASISTSSYTVEAWVRADASGQTNRGLVGAWDSANGGALLELDASGYYTLAHSKTTGNFLHSNVTPRVGQWDYVVASWDGSTERLYVNNIPVASQSMNHAPGTSSASMVIGRNGSGTSFLGGLDEIAIYNAALSSTAVGSHFVAGRPMASDVRLTSTSRFDALGRTIDAWDDAGTRTHYVYDRVGDVTDSTQNYIDGSPSGLTGTDDLHSTYTYDVLGEETSYCPADAVFAMTCGSGASWSWSWDQMGRRASETPPTNTGTGTTARDATTWSYNVDGTLASVSSCPTTACSSVDRHTDYGYDGVLRQTSSTSYAGAGTGSPAVKTATTFRGDGLPVELDEYLNGSGTATDTITETYTASKQIDQVKRGTTVLTDFNYNPDGTVSSRVDGDAGAVGTTSFSYDWAQRVSRVTPPSAWTTNQLIYGYNPNGSLASTNEPNGEVITLGYDNAGRATSASMSSGSSLGRTIDRRGNVTSDTRSFSTISGDPGSNTNTYTFDPLNRLTSESGLTTTGANKTYTYDLDSNRTQVVAGTTTFSYSFDQNDQFVSDLKTGGTTQYFSYDKYGNMTGDAESAINVTTMAYDLADRLTSQTPAGGSATTVSYDALSRPMTRSVPGSGTDTYSYVGTGSDVDRINNSVSGITDSILDAIGARIGTKASATIGWYVDDLLGNVVAAEAGSSTTITDALRYDGYGQTLATYPSSGSAVSKNWKFQDRLDISSSGSPLYEAGARLYTPGLGTFASIDSQFGSAMNPITMNRYLYAGANAVTNTDPTGHTICTLGNFPNCDKVLPGTTQKQIDSMNAAAIKRAASIKNQPTKPAVSGPSGPTSPTSPTNCTELCWSATNGTVPPSWTDAQQQSMLAYLQACGRDSGSIDCLLAAQRLKASWPELPFSLGVTSDPWRRDLPSQVNPYFTVNRWVTVEVTLANTSSMPVEVDISPDGSAEVQIGNSLVGLDSAGKPDEIGLAAPDGAVSFGGFNPLVDETWTGQQRTWEGSDSGFPASISVTWELHQQIVQNPNPVIVAVGAAITAVGTTAANNVYQAWRSTGCLRPVEPPMVWAPSCS